MSEYKYSVIVDNICIAKSMNLEGITLFIKALFEKYYADKDLRVTVQRDDYNQEEGGVFF